MRFSAWMGWLPALLLAACAGAQERPEPREHDATPATRPTGERTDAQEQRSGMTGVCPMAVPGTEVRVQETGSGVALAFTTSEAGHSEELQRRVSHLAAMVQHPGEAKAMKGHGEMHGQQHACPHHASGEPCPHHEQASGMADATDQPPGDAGRPAGAAAWGRAAAVEEDSELDADIVAGDHARAATQGRVAQDEQLDDPRMGQANMPKHEGLDAPPAALSERPAALPPLSARSEPTERGARLVLTPADPADQDALRRQVRERVKMMDEGRCPMMALTGADAPRS